MVTQTTVQNPDAIRFGSGKVEIGATIATLVDVGAADNIVFYPQFDKVELESDNVGLIMCGIKNESVDISFELLEVDLEVLDILRGGIDTYSTVVASPVAVTDEAHTLTDTNTMRLNHKNGDGTEVGSIVVTDAADNAAVRNTDYVITVDSAGYTCIARVAGSTVITDGDGVKVDYSYTPNSSVSFTSGGISTVSSRVVRFTNTNESGETFTVTVYKAYIDSGLNYQFPKDNSFEPVKLKIGMKGLLDTTRLAGDMLFAISDEQAV